MNLKKGKSWGAAVILAIVLLSSCKSLKNTNTLFLSEYDKFADTAKTLYVANQSPESKDKSYKIRPFDLIGVRNLQNPDGLAAVSNTEGLPMGAVFRVDKEGVIKLPVIGEVNVKGLNMDEAAMKIQVLYGKTLLKNPIIEVSIVNYKVTLLGEVGKAGNYPLDRDNYDLIELFGKSGGLSPSADPKRIKIIRGDRKNPEIIFVNLKNIQTLSSDKLMLQNNDIIYVAPQKLYNIAEGLRNYSGVLQPALIALNAIILIYTVRAR
jgi:polysaccharide biosynthesis/export protein